MAITYHSGRRIQGTNSDVTLIQGYAGGTGVASASGAGGGAGAGAVGGNGSSASAGGVGGNGLQSDIAGTVNLYYAGGGGGSCDSTVMSGGSGGGGATSINNGGSATAGTNGLGGGGGGGRPDNVLGVSGGSGIVIIRFATSGNGYSQAGGTVDTSVSGQTIISWTATSGTRTFTPTSAFNVRYLVVAGGGGGGSRIGGGGGAGGFRTSSSHAVTAQAYTIVVGAGGAGGASNSTGAGGQGTNGSDSSFDSITAIGGGGGGRFSTTSASAGSDGGSGGGGGGNASGAAGGAGTSTDNKPTNVQLGSRFEETDTRKMYHYTDPLILDEDFDYTTQALADAKWITNATNVRVNVSTDKLGFAWTASTPNQQCYYDLGTGVSEKKWLLRFVVNYSILTNAGAHLPVADIKMSGSSSSANYPLAASQISFQLSAGSGSANVYFKSTNTSGGGEVSPTAVAWNPTTGTDYYVEMIRTSETHATLNVREVSHSGTMVTDFPMNLTTIDSGCTGLRYLRLQQYPNSFGNITGTMDNVEFYNGVTSTGNTWKEEGT